MAGRTSGGEGRAGGPRLAKVPFEELEVGRRYGPFTYRLTRTQSDNLRGPVGDERPGEVAPPGVFPVLFLQGFADAMGGIPPGGVLAREELELLATAPAEGEVAVEVWIGDKFVKRGRPRGVIELAVRGPEGDTLATGRMVIVWASAEEQEVSA